MGYLRWKDPRGDEEAGAGCGETPSAGVSVGPGLVLANIRATSEKVIRQKREGPQ